MLNAHLKLCLLSPRPGSIPFCCQSSTLITQACGLKNLICALALVQPALSRLPSACLLEPSQPRNRHFHQEGNDVIEPGGGIAVAAGEDDTQSGCSGICSKAGYSAISQFMAQLAATSKWYHCGSIQIEAGSQLLGYWDQLASTLLLDALASPTDLAQTHVPKPLSLRALESLSQLRTDDACSDIMIGDE
ncbi:hypothetical protein B0H19DRAFT_1070997 [Mycena capillaripes]|nr:hypothetical protein B0H19DRAFT_1070997 [Mycena capillaripes]